MCEKSCFLKKKNLFLILKFSFLSNESLTNKLYDGVKSKSIIHKIIEINKYRVKTRRFISWEKEIEKRCMPVYIQGSDDSLSENDINDSIMLSLPLFSSYSLLSHRGWRSSHNFHTIRMYIHDQQYVTCTYIFQIYQIVFQLHILRSFLRRL